jgi:hypothetical protein
MQTFLPYPDFHASASTLDRLRLGKQRVEAMQILRTITGQSTGWRSHPAVRMWQGYPQALASYGLAVCEVWRERGYFDTAADFFDDWLMANGLPWSDSLLPPWLSLPAFHASHRSNLLRKSPEHYGQFGWIEPHDLPYLWPSQAHERSQEG